MRKKAVTPLISSLFLIFFAVVLGIVVMSWGKTTDINESGSCEQSSAKIIEINDQPQACYKGNKLYYTLENNGKTTLSGAKLSVIGDRDIYSTELSFTISSTGLLKLETDYANNVGNILQLRFVPKVGNELCPDKIFKTDNINGCS